MAEKSCASCVYGKRPGGRWLRVALLEWPGMVICSACADHPGQTVGLPSNGVCRNYLAKPGAEVPVEPRLGRRPDASEIDEAKVRRIPLTKGKFALVDAEDYEELSKYKWYALRGKHTWYACRREKGKIILMHRQIMDTPQGMVVDHLNRDGWDNRQENLRNCTHAQNNRNSRPRSGNTGLRGVRYDEQTGKYIGAVHHKGHKHSVGEFDDPVEAALARDRKAYELQGEFAYLNFPERIRDAGSADAAAV